MNKRFKKIIINCQNLREKHGFEYEVKCKNTIEKYSQEIINNNLIEKCEDKIFAMQLCMMNDLKYEK